MTVRQSTLPNGLRVVTERMPYLKTAAVAVWIDAGSRYESLALNGVSHLLEHMLFKGTRSRSARDIAEEIEAVGGHMNAFTSRDHTSYYARVLAEHMPLAIDLLSDILVNASFEPRELAREQEVIVQEIGQVMDTPDDIVFDMLHEQAFPDQPLGRSILGTEANVENFDSPTVRAYRDSHYRGRNMVITAAGQVDHDQVVDLVGQAFAPLQADYNKHYEPGQFKGGLAQDDRSLEQVHLTFGFPSLAFDDPDYYALLVYSTILGGGMSSRLFQEVREERGLAYSVYSFTSPHADTGLFGIYAGTDPEAAGEVVPVIADQVRGLCTSVTDKEIDRARAQLKAELLMSLERTTARVEQMGRQMLIWDRIIPTDEMITKVDAVDIDAVRRVCARTLDIDSLALATVGPRGNLPDYDAILAAFAG